MNIPYVMKKCTKCGEWKVASTYNFYRHKGGKYGLHSKCKECRNKENKKWRLENKDKMTECRKRWNENNKDKMVEYHKQYSKRWNENNKDKKREYDKRYREANREKKAEYDKQRYEANREKELERVKKYRQTPQGQVAMFNSQQRRRIKEEQQGDGITKDQWLEMMSFFDWKCAYSGEYLGGNDNSFNRTIDHIVPLNSNGDNMIWNCVPMLRSLNSSKQAKDMLEWYEEQSFYDPKRLAKIYEWQEYARKKWEK